MLAITIRPDDAIARKIEALKNASSSVNIRISEIVRVHSFRVIQYAKELVPISTGALRRSIIADFFNGGMAAIIGSYLPYAARQEFDMTLDHSVRQPRTRQKNTIAGRKGTVIKGTGQSNPDATWGFMRKALAKVAPGFQADLRAVANTFRDGWGSA